MCYFLKGAHSPEQKPYMMTVLLHDTHYSVKSTEAMRTICIGQKQNILVQWRIELSISALGF